jgi:hypothetical protein
MSAELAEELFKKCMKKQQHSKFKQTRSHMNFFRTPKGKSVD